MPQRARLISIAASVWDFLRVVGLKSPMGAAEWVAVMQTSLPQQSALVLLLHANYLFF
jgi:hypothetical protein